MGTAVKVNRAHAIERMVVVDDDRLDLQMFALSVPQNVNLFVATHEEDGRSLCHQHRPELALVDLRPSAEGRLACLASLKEASPGTRVVVTSAYASVDLAVRAMRAGADDVVSKPISFYEIVHRLHREEALELTVPSLDRVQWEHAQRVFATCGGNMTHTARQLGVPRSTLRRWITRPAPRA